MHGLFLLSLFVVLSTSQLLQFPTNVKWADIRVTGAMNLDEFGDQRAQVSGSIQYYAPSDAENAMHTKLQVSLGITIPLESWLTASPTQLSVATIGSIPGLEGCQLVNIPASSVVCKNWVNHGSVSLRGHSCVRYQRDCEITISEEVLEEHPELSMLVGAVTFVVFTERDQPYLIQSNVTSIVDGEEFKTSINLMVTSVGKTQPSPDSLRMPADCREVAPGSK